MKSNTFRVYYAITQVNIQAPTTRSQKTRQLQHEHHPYVKHSNANIAQPCSRRQPRVSPTSVRARTHIRSVATIWNSNAVSFGSGSAPLEKRAPAIQTAPVDARGSPGGRQAPGKLAEKQRRAHSQPEGGREGKQRGCYYSYWRRSLDNCNLWRRIDRSSRSESERSSANERASTASTNTTTHSRNSRATVMAGRQDGAPAAPMPRQWPFCPEAATVPERCERRRPALASSCCASPGVAACVQSRGEARPPSSGAVAAPGPPPTPHTPPWALGPFGAFFTGSFLINENAARWQQLPPPVLINNAADHNYPQGELIWWNLLARGLNYLL